MNSQKFASKIAITDSGEMVQVSRVVLPEDEYCALVEEETKSKVNGAISRSKDFEIYIKRIKFNEIEHH